MGPHHRFSVDGAAQHRLGAVAACRLVEFRARPCYHYARVFVDYDRRHGRPRYPSEAVRSFAQAVNVNGVAVGARTPPSLGPLGQWHRSTRCRGLRVEG